MSDISELTDPDITDFKFNTFKENEFASADEYRASVERILGNRPDTKPDFSVARIVTILRASGQRETKTVLEGYEGTPKFKAVLDHLIDSYWFYPAKQPEEAGVSLAEYRAAGGPQNHRFYPSPSVTA